MSSAVADQQQLFQQLIKTGSKTEFGADHNFAAIKTHEDYVKKVPIRDYEAFKPYIEKIKEVEDWVFIGFKGIIKMQDYEQIDITIEEYNEIIKLHEEKSLEKDLRTLSNLCNNE